MYYCQGCETGLFEILNSESWVNTGRRSQITGSKRIIGLVRNTLDIHGISLDFNQMPEKLRLNIMYSWFVVVSTYRSLAGAKRLKQMDVRNACGKYNLEMLLSMPCA